MSIDEAEAEAAVQEKGERDFGQGGQRRGGAYKPSAAREEEAEDTTE